MMLLGIPGDNTYANYQEASRGLWRQTVLPLVNRTAKALSGWLAPGFGPDRLVLKPDLDQIEALSSEREALWARLEKASFLTDDEKRASIGYGPKSAGSIARGSGRGGEPPIDRAAKFNPYHDELGRFTTADGAASGSGGQEAGDEDVESADDGSADDDAGLQQVNSRRNQLVTVGGRTYQATPEQATVLSTSATRADAALRRVRELDPEWRPAPSLSGPNSAEGAIATYRALAQQAEARLTVIERGGLPLGFNSREEYATFGRSARTALNEAGFPEAVPYLRGSAVTGYSYRTGEAFDVGRRSDYDIAIVSPRLFEHLIARGIETSGRGSRTLAVGPAELPAGPLRNWLEQVIRNRPSSIVVHRGLGELERRGPYAAMD